MKTITFKVYEFDELSEKAQNVVVNNHKKDAVFKNPESIFNRELEKSLECDMIPDLKNMINFDSTRLKIKPIKDFKFKLSVEGIKKDEHFMAMYGDSDDLEKILNAEFTVNYDGKNVKKIKVTTENDIGHSAVPYYLAGMVGGNIDWINSMVENTIENGRPTYDVRNYVYGMLFHADGTDLTDGEKLVVEERKNSN